jgi:hypothetical protein
VAFLTGTILSLHIVIGEQVPDPAIRRPADQCLGRRAAARLLPPVLAAQLGLEHASRACLLLGVAEASVTVFHAGCASDRRVA